MTTSLQQAMWEDQEKRYGSPEYIQDLLDKAAEFEAQYGDEPSAWERLRQIENKINNVTPVPPADYKKPAGPVPFKLPFQNTDQFLVASSDDDLTLDYFLDQGKQIGISPSSGLDKVIPMLVGAMSKFPNASNLAQVGMEYGYDLLPGFHFTKPSQAAVQAAASLAGVSVNDYLAQKTIENLQDPVVQAGDYKEDEPGLIGALLSQGENLGAQGNTTGVYGGVPQLLNLIDNIQGTGVQDLQSFFEGLGGILGIGEGDIENVKQAARDVDEDDLSRVYT